MRCRWSESWWIVARIKSVGVNHAHVPHGPAEASLAPGASTSTTHVAITTIAGETIVATVVGYLPFFLFRQTLIRHSTLQTTNSSVAQRTGDVLSSQLVQGLDQVRIYLG